MIKNLEGKTTYDFRRKKHAQMKPKESFLEGMAPSLFCVAKRKKKGKQMEKRKTLKVETIKRL